MMITSEMFVFDFNNIFKFPLCLIQPSMNLYCTSIGETCDGLVVLQLEHKYSAMN